MKLAIVGYGKMGQQVERLLADMPEHEVVSIACRKVGDDLTAKDLKGVDVAIDFSHPSLMKDHISIYSQQSVSAVIGTTGWDVDDTEIIKQIESSGIGVVVGSNFSAGVQIFIQLVNQAARELYRVGGYDVYGMEIHHRHKLDSPSGTARTIASGLVESFPAKQRVNYDRIDGEPISADTLHFSSVRAGGNRGFHQVVFDSLADEICLNHRAISREGFASGAISAAEWLVGKSGYFKYEDLFKKEIEDGS